MHLFYQTLESLTEADPANPNVGKKIRLPVTFSFWWRTRWNSLLKKMTVKEQPIKTPAPEKEWTLRLEFKLEDLWIGAFWRKESNGYDVWICLLPCLPIHYSCRYLKRRATRRAKAGVAQAQKVDEAGL